MLLHCSGTSDCFWAPKTRARLEHASFLLLAISQRSSLTSRQNKTKQSPQRRRARPRQGEPSGAAAGAGRPAAVRRRWSPGRGPRGARGSGKGRVRAAAVRSSEGRYCRLGVEVGVGSLRREPLDGFPEVAHVGTADTLRPPRGERVRRLCALLASSPAREVSLVKGNKTKKNKTIRGRGRRNPPGRGRNKTTFGKGDARENPPGRQQEQAGRRSSGDTGVRDEAAGPR